MRNVYTFSLSVVLLLSIFPCLGKEGMVQPRKLIDCHTAGLLPKGYFDLDLRLFTEGGIITSAGVGLTDRLNIGVAYGAERLIGQRKAKGYPWPGALIKYRIMEESYVFPALAMGFDSQGYGAYDHNRFYFKSKGAFVVLSKNFLLIGHPLGLHGGVNYSVMDSQRENFISELDTLPVVDKNNYLNGYIGLDKSINEEIAVVVEYDLALDDNLTHNVLYGYLNAGIRYQFDEFLYLELDFKDILGQKRVFSGVDIFDDPEFLNRPCTRELRIVFLQSF
jgi:hypothetical protein